MDERINPMKVLILFESFFGNTKKVARAIGDCLSARAEVQVVRVNDVQPDQLKGLNLLIVGSPTRGFRPGEATQRFLANLPTDSLKDIKAAAFDTRIDPNGVTSKMLKFLVKSFGYADKALVSGLEKKGASMVSTGQGFIVKGSEGPFKEDELERAAEWAKTLL
jgi:flavodoxin